MSNDRSTTKERRKNRSGRRLPYCWTTRGLGSLVVYSPSKQWWTKAHKHFTGSDVVQGKMVRCQQIISYCPTQAIGTKLMNKSHKNWPLKCERTEQPWKMTILYKELDRCKDSNMKLNGRELVTSRILMVIKYYIHEDKKVNTTWSEHPSYYGFKNQIKETTF